MPFEVEPTAIPEVLLVRPKRYGDERGWFAEVWQGQGFEGLGGGLPTAFAQVNQSRSARGVVRGLHFQWDPPQGKLMRVVRGRAFMVAVDIRPGSPTLGRVVTCEGSDEEPLLFWAPASFARGFCALSDVTEIEYFCTAPYDAAHEAGIRWDDPALAIPWPIADPQLSARDAAAPTLAAWLERPESEAFRPRRLIRRPAPTPYFRLVPGRTVRCHHPDVHRLRAAFHRPDTQGRPPSRPPAARLHVVVFGAGVLILCLGIAGRILDGGPSTFEGLVLVLDLVIGGTLLVTAALVGRARAAEARRSAQLSVLQQAARRMTASLTREDVGRAVVEETRRVIDYHNARVYLHEPPDALVPVAFEGRVGAYQTVDLDILRTTVGTGFTGWVAKHRTAIRVDDALADPRGVTIPGTENLEESMLVVPMLHDDVLVGVVTLSKLGLNGFDEHDLRLLTTLADQAATAFMSTRHLAEADRLTAELRQLLDMSSALSRSLDPIAVADLMAQHLARAVGAGSAQISAWDKGEDRLRTLGCHPPEIRQTVGDTYLLTGFPLTRTVLEERVIATVDVEDPDADAAEVALLRQEGHGGLLMLPLIAKDQGIGLVELTFEGRPATDVGLITLARTMAHEAAMALENATLYEIARRQADHDPLTGFTNHRALHERLTEEVVRAVRTHRPLSVVMIDLDDFKLVNDSFGHVYGDRVLVHVAELMRSTLRASDVAARYGGDEFAVILPETDRAQATAIAARMLDAFRTTPLVGEGRGAFWVGGSMGIATYPEDGRTATDLIAVADLGLYAAKGEGGNLVRTRDPGTATHSPRQVVFRRTTGDAGEPSIPGAVVGSGDR